MKSKIVAIFSGELNLNLNSVCRMLRALWTRHPTDGAIREGGEGGRRVAIVTGVKCFNDSHLAVSRPGVRKLTPKCKFFLVSLQFFRLFKLDNHSPMNEIIKRLLH